MYTRKVLLWTKNFQQVKGIQWIVKQRDPVRSQIVINNNIIEEITNFYYPGCPISYQNKKAVAVKVSIFLR
jgi:hypothetical protein